MNNSIFHLEMPQNEPILSYAPGTGERELLKQELERQASTQIEIPLIIGGKEVRTGDTANVVMPHDHQHVLATYHKAGEAEVKLAIETALIAQKDWMNMPWIERASIQLRVANLLSTKYRWLINAATMLGQSKNAFQAEIDSACETIDFLRFNAHFASRIYQSQPNSGFDQLNRIEYRPLEGFVLTVTPFNFTAIASNLNMSAALMGNVTVWKPATAALLSNYYLMKVFKEAGMPDGVINFLPGSGSMIGRVSLAQRELAGVHFTGSNNTFNHIWRTVSHNLGPLRSYPRLVGETGGKDFIFAHESADPSQVATAIVRGAFEYQGQKCSAASRCYIPKSMWNEVRELLESMIAEIKMGDPRDFGNFVNAVIDEKSYETIKGFIEKTLTSSDAEVIIGGNCDKSKGYFIEPTVILASDPKFLTMQEEIFGPVVSIYVYDDAKYEETLELCDQTSPYALTGAIFSNDRYATLKALDKLRFAAGNFYINDKPTGAVVGMQPFGGSRASGTNDKAGGMQNLMRWVSPRTIKETYNPPMDYKYPFLR